MRVIPTSPTVLAHEDILALAQPFKPKSQLKLALEQRLATHFGRRYAVLTSSGTAGIYLALKSLGLPSRAEVIVPAYTCIRVPHAITGSGLIPRFVDIDETANMDVTAIEAALTSRVGCIVLTHMYGNPGHIDKIIELAQAHGLDILEDGCMTFDMSYQKYRCGTLGKLSVFSLNRSKLISSFGGGVVLTDDPLLAERMREIRGRESRLLTNTEYSALLRALLINNFMFHPWIFGNIGKRLSKKSLFQLISKRLNRLPAFNVIPPVQLSELTSFQLRLGLSQLDRALWFTERRRQIAELFTKELFGISAEFIKTIPGAFPGWSHFSLLLGSHVSRTDIIHKLAQHGIQAGELFNYVCPLTTAYQDLGQTSFPKSEHLAKRVVNLPFYPYLSDNDQSIIIAGTRAVLS